MKKNWKRIASFLLAAALLLGMVPAISAAANAETYSGSSRAPADGVYLSDLEWVSAKHYYDALGAVYGVQKNHCAEYPWYCDTPGNPSTEQERYPGSGIYMNGDTTTPVLFEKCLGVAPDATIIYDISGLKAVRFESDIGVEFTKFEPWRQNGGDTETNVKGRCQFEVYADGVQIYKSELLNPTNGRHISVDIPEGTKELKLVNKAYGSATGNDPNTNFASDSEWGNPLLVLEKDTEELILSDMDWVSAKHYYDAFGAVYGVQKNHCAEYPWYCDTPGDPSTEQARYPGSGIYMNGDTTTPVLFEKCLGVAPDATIIYDISGLNAVKFDSDIGVEFTKLGPWQQQGGSENTVYGRCQFEVYADGVQIYKSELLNPTNGRHISVDIPEGTKELKLVNKAYGSATGNDPNTNFASDSEWGTPTLTVRKSSKTWKYLSDMDWTSQLSFYNRISLDYTAYGVQKDRIPQYSFYLNKLDELPTFSTYMNGKSKIYEKGLGMKPDSYAIYDITGMNAEKLTADIGICDYWYDQYMEHKAALDTDPTAIEEHAAQFIVYADGVPVYQTGVDELVYPDSSRHIEVDIPNGTKTLKLECRNYWYAMTGSQLSTDDNRNYGSNDAMWGDAKLIFGSSSEEPELPDAPELGENELWLSEQPSIYDYMEGKDPLKKDGKMTLRDADGRKQIYVKGLTGNAKAFATYDIAGMGVTMLKAEIGVDAVMNNIGQTVFTVEADGKPVYTSKDMNAADPAEHIEVAITKGTERLTIYAADAKSPSRAIWANAVLVVDKSTAVTPQPNPDDRYIEIQAGLAQTQYECLPMPPRTAWEWLEAYGAMNADPAQVHGAWHGAQAAVEAQLETLIPQEQLEQLLRQTRDTMAKRPAQALLCRGSGWGALENLRRARAGEPQLSPQLDFGEPGAEQAPWRALLELGAMGEYDPREPVLSWLPDTRYLPLLAQAAQGAEHENWHTWLQLGVALLTQGRFAEAQDALLRADGLTRCAWVKYACSCLHLMRHEPERAAAYARQAAEVAPEDASVLKFALRVLLEAQQYGEALRLIAAAPPELRRLPRVQLSETQALVGLDRLEEAEAILMQDGGLIVPDIREGEQTMSEVWLTLQQKKRGLGREAAEKAAPVPHWMDFRMN